MEKHIVILKMDGQKFFDVATCLALETKLTVTYVDQNDNKHACGFMDFKAPEGE